MNLYSFVYNTKYLITKKLRLGNLRNYDYDIVSYTNNFNNKHPQLFGNNHCSGTNAPVIILYSPMPLSYCMQTESIIAKRLEKSGFLVVILTNYQAKILSDNIHRKIHGFNNILYIEDFMKFSISKEAKNAIINSINKAKSIDEVMKIKYKNTNIGIHSLASFSASLYTGKVVLNKNTRKRIARFATASCRYVEASEKVLNLIKPQKILSVEKGLVSTCEVFYESIHRGIDYIQWTSCHEPNSIMMKRYNTNNFIVHPFSVSEKSWTNCLNDKRDYSEVIFEIFKQGYITRNWFGYKKLTADKILIDRNEIIQRLRLNPNKKNAVIFSHILNDANFFYGDDLFKNGFPEWLVETVKIASQNDKVNWLLKLHPANIYRRANMRYSGEYGEILAIREALGGIPKNIVIIPPDIEINPYSFFVVADYGITVRGTIGAELPCFGIPVLTAGTGRYSGRGFTIDFKTPEEYLDKIANIDKVEPLSEYQRSLAIKHAYLFFKERPAKYDTFLHDIYPYPVGHPLNRDIEITNNNFLENEQLLNIANFIAFSKDEDFISSKTYG